MHELKALESEPNIDSNSELYKGKKIFEVEPSSTIATTKIQSTGIEELEEGERLFNSKCGQRLLHFILLSIMESKRTSS